MRAASSASRDRQRTLRQWARRFRRRWGATNTNLSTLDAPPRAALGAKAGGTNKPPKLAPRFLESTAGAVQILDSRGLKSNPYYGLVFAHDSWNPEPAPFKSWIPGVQNRVRITALFLGPSPGSPNVKLIRVQDGGPILSPKKWTRFWPSNMGPGMHVKLIRVQDCGPILGPKNGPDSGPQTWDPGCVFLEHWVTFSRSRCTVSGIGPTG